MKLVLELAGYFVLQGLDLKGLKGDCSSGPPCQHISVMPHFRCF